MKFADLDDWIRNALSLSDYTDGAIHADAAGTMAVAMQQGPRPEQQDCGVALLWVARGGVLLPRCAAVVADGMGGMEDGGWASREAVRIVVARCLSGEHDRPRDMLADALPVRSGSVLEALGGRGGTTLTAAVWERRSGMLVHTGDTRAHLLEPGRPFRCLTTDHTQAGLADALERLTTGPAGRALPADRTGQQPDRRDRRTGRRPRRTPRPAHPGCRQSRHDIGRRARPDPRGRDGRLRRGGRRGALDRTAERGRRSGIVWRERR